MSYEEWRPNREREKKKKKKAMMNVISRSETATLLGCIDARETREEEAGERR